MHVVKYDHVHQHRKQLRTQFRGDLETYCSKRPPPAENCRLSRSDICFGFCDETYLHIHLRCSKITAEHDVRISAADILVP